MGGFMNFFSTVEHNEGIYTFDIYGMYYSKQ